MKRNVEITASWRSFDSRSFLGLVSTYSGCGRIGRNQPKKRSAMTSTPRTRIDYLRLTALAGVMEQLLMESNNRLSNDDVHLLFDLSSQLRGMSALLLQKDHHWAVDVAIQSAAEEYARINLSLGPKNP